MTDPLKVIRDKIDALDKEIVSLIQDRASLAFEIGQIKIKNGEPIYRPDREKDVLEKVQNLSQGPLPKQVIASIYREIMSGTIALEHPVKVGFLGPIGSFSHEALRSKFGSAIESEPHASIRDVFQSLDRDKIDYGIVPVENSTEGSVSSTLDMFLESQAKIYAELNRKISFSLLGYEKDLTKVKKIYGIKIGNEQCRNFIAGHLPHAEIIETSSTAMAAKIVSESKDGVAIASVLASEIYGLEILRENIEDYSGNTTRFLILSRSICPPTGNDKTSIVISLPNKTGALFSALKVFQDQGINLSKIESRPLKRNLWEYHFYIDFLGHKEDPSVAKVLALLSELVTFLKVLGSYPIGTDVS